MTTRKIIQQFSVALFAMASLLVASAGFAQAPRKNIEEPHWLTLDQCVTCHTEDDNLPEGFSLDDIHMRQGLSCAGCHGGDAASDDPDVAMSRSAGFVGVPTRQQTPNFCGKCHSDITFMRKYRPRIPTDQVEQYLTSIHGMRLSGKNDSRVAVCTSCHNAHGVLPPSDARSPVHPLNVPATCNHCHGDPEYMAPYGIPTNQFEGYAKGVHGIALLERKDTGAPACNDCHGNHGAMPPGVSSIKQVCGNCHVNNARYFAETVMSAAFEENDLHGCEECHGNHEIYRPVDDMVGTGNESVCVNCHGEDSKGFATAAKIHSQISNLAGAYETAVEKQKDVQRKGMDDVEIGYLLKDAHQRLIESRTLVHTFDPKQIAPKTGEGIALTRQAMELAEATITDFHIRRRGFGIATMFITVLVIALFFKIREIDRK